MLGSARSSAKTLTEAAQEEIRQAILRGTYQPGSQLPGELELVEMLGVSRTVVRAALRLLEEDGLITRRHGVGTFVRKAPILNNLSLDFGTTQMILSAGMAPGTTLIEARVEGADDEVASVLDLEPGTPVVTMRRVRTADGRPVVFSLDVMPKTLIDDVEQLRKLTAQHESLYAVIQSHFGQVIEYGVARILPVAAPEDIAAQLGVPAGSVMLYFKQTDYSPAEEPILYSREYHIPDAFDFMILRRGPIRESTSPSPAPGKPGR